MPFSWQQTKRPRSRGRDEMYLREIEERAALLYRLGFPRARAQQRLQANSSWDFEVGGGAPAANAIAAAVDAVYQRGGLRHGAPSV